MASNTPEGMAELYSIQAQIAIKQAEIARLDDEIRARNDQADTEVQTIRDQADADVLDMETDQVELANEVDLLSAKTYSLVRDDLLKLRGIKYDRQLPAEISVFAGLASENEYVHLGQVVVIMRGLHNYKRWTGIVGSINTYFLKLLRAGMVEQHSDDVNCYRWSPRGKALFIECQCDPNCFVDQVDGLYETKINPEIAIDRAPTAAVVEQPLASNP